MMKSDLVMTIIIEDINEVEYIVVAIIRNTILKSDHLWIRDHTLPD